MKTGRQTCLYDSVLLRNVRTLQNIKCVLSL
jgi:hypothetical protein